MATGIQLVLGITGTGKNRVSETQSILFDKSQYTVTQARQWLKSHGYKDGQPDITKGKLRFRQQAPGKFREFATKPLGNPSLLSRAYHAAFPPSLEIRDIKDTSKYKGYSIYLDWAHDGWRTTAEKDSLFDSKKDAQRFIDAMVKGRNPGSRKKAVKLSEEFHGRQAKETIDITEPDTQRTDYALLGELKELEIVDGPKSVIPVEFHASKKSDCVYLAASPSGEQLYLIGGDQHLNLNDFDYLTDTERKKDKVVLGLLHSVTYHTDKHHLEGPATQKTGEDYFHVFASPVEGAGDGEKPTLIYDRLNERMGIDGGSYCVKDVGIVG